MKETLRLSSPAPTGGIREVVDEEGADICGYHLPKVSRLSIMGCVSFAILLASGLWFLSWQAMPLLSQRLSAHMSTPTNPAPQNTA
jgi:hypothetical protein